MLILNTVAIDAVNNGDDIPFYIQQDGENVVRLRWHATSSYRGYYDVKAVNKSGWKKYDYDGWVTGDWDDAPVEARSSTVHDNLERLAKTKDEQGYDVLAVFTPTSNVFSTGFDVFTRKRKVAGKRRKLANNTYLYEDEKRRAIRLHSTDILVEEKGQITINTGGWDTLTTRDRLNRYLPSYYHVVRDRGQTYLVDRGERKPLKDGMKVAGRL